MLLWKWSLNYIMLQISPTMKSTCSTTLGLVPACLFSRCSAYLSRQASANGERQGAELIGSETARSNSHPSISSNRCWAPWLLNFHGLSRWASAIFHGTKLLNFFQDTLFNMWRCAPVPAKARSWRSMAGGARTDKGGRVVLVWAPYLDGDRRK